MRIAVAATLCVFLAMPAWADSEKEQDCRYQSQVAAAVQKARLDGVAERNVERRIVESNPTWPERYNRAIPVLAGAIYQENKSMLRKVDLGAQWMEMCMSQ